MIGSSIVLVAIAGPGFMLKRREGALLLGLCGGYLRHPWPKP
jgi:hypothetical protein